MDGQKRTQIAKFMGPTCGPPGSCRPQMGHMLALWTLLSGGVTKTTPPTTLNGLDETYMDAFFIQLIEMSARMYNCNIGYILYIAENYPLFDPFDVHLLSIFYL